MKNVMIKHLGTIRLSATIGMFNEASVLAIGEDIVVADVLRNGKFRYRQVLENVSPADIDFDAKIIFVSKSVRRKLHRLFDEEPISRGNSPHFAEWSEHRISAPGDFVPLVRRGEVLVADYSMSGTHYFRLSEEDLAWLEHRDGLVIR